MESQRLPPPPIPNSGLPSGWSIEQWEYYGHEYLESNPSVNDGVKCWVCIETISTDTYQICPQCNARYHQSGTDGCFASALEKCRNCGHPAQLFNSSGITTVPSVPDYSAPIQPMISAPGTGVPSQVYNYDDGATKRSRKRILLGGSIGVIFLVTILVLALLPPGNLVLMDDYRDRDSDGLTDSVELDMGTDPELADTDGDGLDDSDEACPNGVSNWHSGTNTDHDRDGCRDFAEDEDDDNDGVLDVSDNCPKGVRDWKSHTDWGDMDGDGCRDDDEDWDDDGDGWGDQNELDCNSNPRSFQTKPADLDSDLICDILDPDDDGDGWDDNVDAFPRDSTEWVDFDQDGTGDNADTDDDNDGVPDYLDANDYADVGILLSLNSFRVITEMDVWDSYAEVYICMFIEGENVGCGPDADGYYWSMQTSYEYEIETELFVDLPEENETHLIQICAWDDDGLSEDDRIDINPSSENNCYWFYFDSTGTSLNEELLVSGTGDNTGWDGELGFSYEFIDVRNQRFNEFNWDYGGVDYEMSVNLDYDTYAYFKNKNHDVEYDDVSTYARFATPSEQYVIDVANQLEALAISNGITSQLDIAEFVYAFVGDIQYVLDIEGVGENEYPKYPIEMLWESSGDCEDAAILYISLIEALGYDAQLAIGEVKTSEDDDWGGHAWALVYIPNHSGQGWYGLGEKSDLPFYFVEATAYYDGTSYIGRNPWHDTTGVSFYDVE